MYSISVTYYVKYISKYYFLIGSSQLKLILQPTSSCSFFRPFFSCPNVSLTSRRNPKTHRVHFYQTIHFHQKEKKSCENTYMQRFQQSEAELVLTRFPSVRLFSSLNKWPYMLLLMISSEARLPSNWQLAGPDIRSTELRLPLSEVFR